MMRYMSDWMQVEIMLASVEKGITKLLLIGILATYDLLVFQPEMLPSAFGLGQHFSLQVQQIKHPHTQSIAKS